MMNFFPTIREMHVEKQVRVLFAPPPPPDKTTGGYTLESTDKTLQTQKIARIAKTVFYVLATLAVTTIAVLAEASLLTLPLSLGLLGVILVSGAVFWRFNSLDEKYLAGLPDETRANLVKDELHSLITEEPKRAPEKIEKALKQINRLIGQEIFSADYRQKASQGHFDKINFSKSWVQKGRYNLSSYDVEAIVKWEAQPDIPPEVTFKRTKKDQQNQKEGFATILPEN